MTLAVDSELTSAFGAFRSDSSYFARMSLAALKLADDEQTKIVRADLRVAEKAAKEQCSDAAFVCVSQAPCGTGDCPFASGQFAELGVPRILKGRGSRPQENHVAPSYSLEAQVPALKGLRAV